MAEPGWGFRYEPADGSQSPTPMVVRTVDVPGSQVACGTRIWTWRRNVSTRTVGVGDRAFPVAASMKSALSPCHVTKSVAGDDTPAPSGQATDEPESPSAMVNAVRLGSISVFSVTRNAVTFDRALIRNSTRSAALSA